MADRLYAGTPADFAIALGAETALLDEAGTPIGSETGWAVLIPTLPGTFDVYDAEATQYTDLLDSQGSPVTVITPSSAWETAGQVLLFTVNDAPDGDVYLVGTGGTPFDDPTFRLSPATDEIFERITAVEATSTGVAWTSTPPTDGQMPKFVNSAGEVQWVAGVAPTELDDLNDVNTSGAPTGQTRYLGTTDGGTSWIPLPGAGGVTDHSQLAGLSSDDHTQYLNQTRGDLRYYTKAQSDTAIAGSVAAASVVDRNRVNHTGAQAISTVTGLSAELAVRMGLAGGAASVGAVFWGIWEEGSAPTPPDDGKIHWGFEITA